MQEPKKPVEPKVRLLDYEVSDFDSDDFNKLNTLKEQLAYIEICKKEYLSWHEKTAHFKLELLAYPDDTRIILNAYIPESEASYQNSLKLYQKQLLYYEQQLKEYTAYKKQLYLQLKEEFDV